MASSPDVLTSSHFLETTLSLQRRNCAVLGQSAQYPPHYDALVYLFVSMDVDTVRSVLDGVDCTRGWDRNVSVHVRMGGLVVGAITTGTLEDEDSTAGENFVQRQGNVTCVPSYRGIHPEYARELTQHLLK